MKIKICYTFMENRVLSEKGSVFNSTWYCIPFKVPYILSMEAIF